MTDVNDVRAQMYHDKRKEEGGNKLFLALLILLPVLGGMGGLAWKFTSGGDKAPEQTAAAPQALSPEPGTGSSVSTLTNKQKWLSYHASKNPALATALVLEPDYPELVEFQQYQLVLMELNNCDKSYPQDDSYRYFHNLYFENNRTAFDRASEKAEASGAWIAFGDVVLDKAVGKFWGMTLSGKDYNAMLEEIGDEWGGYEKDPAMGSGQCIFLKQLVQLGKMNLKS